MLFNVLSANLSALTFQGCMISIIPARGRLPKHAHATLDIYIFLLMNASACFSFNFRSSSRAGAWHGTLPRCTCPFWVLPYLFMLFIYVEHPIKLFKKKRMKQSATAINSHRFDYDCDHITRSAILVLPQTQKFAGGKMSGCER